MKRIFLRIAGLAFVAVALLAGCGKKEKVPAPTLAPPAPPVSPPVVQVTPTTKPDVPVFTEAIATLDGSTNTQIHSQVSGYLIKQAYQEGSMVKKGDLLFLIDTKPFQPDGKKSQILPGETKIVAPSDGVAGKALPGLGDLVTPGTPLTTLSKVDPIAAVFAVPRKYYLDNTGRIARVLALPAEARPEALDLLLPDGTTYSHKGKWDSIERPAPASTGPVTACALFPNPDHVLRPGEYVKVRVGAP
jgi:membrane fusion protein (multidrug efflux system)